MAGCVPPEGDEKPRRYAEWERPDDFGDLDVRCASTEGGVAVLGSDARGRVVRLDVRRIWTVP